MDKLEKQRAVLQNVVRKHAGFQPANGQIATHAVCDAANDEYMVVDTGWSENGRRIYDVVLHFRLTDGKIHVERDNTDAEVVEELIENGIERRDIVLAFNSAAYQRLNDSIAV